MSAIRFREFSETSHAEILKLFEAAFGKPNDLSHWSWEYLEGPRKPLVVLVEADGMIAGHYAVLPRRIRAYDAEMEAGLVVDVMTHPSFGRRGIFSKAGLEAFRAGNAAGVELFIGFPNDAAIRGHLKVGWTELGSVRVYVRPISLSGVLKSSSKIAALTPAFLTRALGLAIVAVNKVAAGEPGQPGFEWSEASESPGLWHELAQLYSEHSRTLVACGVKDVNWLRWRLSEPTGTTHVLVKRDRASRGIAGALFLKIKVRDGIKTGAILDVVPGQNRRLACELQREAVRKCVQEGCELAIRFRSPHAGFPAPPVRLFFIPTPKKVRFIVRSTGDRPLPDSVTALANWHIELIDHDSF